MKSPGDGAAAVRARPRARAHAARPGSARTTRCLRAVLEAAAPADGALGRRRGTGMTPEARRGRLAVVTGALGKLGPVWIRSARGAGATVVGLDLQRRTSSRAHDCRQSPTVTDRDALGDIRGRDRRARRARQQRRHRPAAEPGRRVVRRGRPARRFRRMLDVNLRARSTSSRSSAPRWRARGAARSSTSARSTRRSRPSRASTTTWADPPSSSRPPTARRRPASST